MGINKRRPLTPTQRYQEYDDYADVTRTKPTKSLMVAIRKKGGRNSNGRITCRHRGGGHPDLYRIIDFKRDKFGIPAHVESIEYDPNRSTRIALLRYKDGEKRYILAPLGLTVGMQVISGPGSPLRVGNALPLSEIPEGMELHNLELRPGCGGQLIRSAGMTGQILTKEGVYAHIRMPSTEVRLVSLKCFATIGQLSNVEHSSISIGKAGRTRWLGIRPRVRAVHMNPVDHPMGGGEAKSKGHIPQSPTGVPAKGYKTRKRKLSDKYIVKGRKRGK
ncbi:MAG: 50S ribosomal protein L2 [bacterium]|nr:50S ribosomal protein L2 [bacterium]